jgi:hypothetical protein
LEEEEAAVERASVLELGDAAEGGDDDAGGVMMSNVTRDAAPASSAWVVLVAKPRLKYLGVGDG